MSTFVTAEIGTNWNGDAFKLRRMVHECKEAGVDAVKFQVLTEELIARHPELSWYQSASVNVFTLPEIVDTCWRENIQWYASVFDEGGVDLIKKHVDMIKIRDRKSVV